MSSSRIVVLFFFVFPTLTTAQCGVGSVHDPAGDRCLQFYRASVDFKTAESICSVSSGHLVSIHNTISNNFIAGEAQKYFYTTWLGAATIAPDVTNLMNWFWADGTEFNYQNYQVGQPTQQGPTSCLQLQAFTGKWVTAPCTSTLPFICQYPTKTTPTCATPIVPSHCPSGYAWFEETDSCYKNYVEYTNFNDAKSTCQGDGGDLASIHSAGENEFIVGLSKTGAKGVQDVNNDVWIGLYFQSQKWHWTDGSNVTFVNWADGEPNNMNSEWWTSLMSDPHLSQSNKEQKWNNVAQVDQRAFVCKRAALH